MSQIRRNFSRMINIVGIWLMLVFGKTKKSNVAKIPSEETASAQLTHFAAQSRQHLVADAFQSALSHRLWRFTGGGLTLDRKYQMCLDSGPNSIGSSKKTASTPHTWYFGKHGIWWANWDQSSGLKCSISIKCTLCCC